MKEFIRLAFLGTLWMCILLTHGTTLEEMKKVCGMSSYETRMQKRIVGGIESKRGEWPWLVSIYLKERQPLPEINKRAKFEMSEEEFIRRQNEENKKDKIYILNYMKTDQQETILEKHICGGTLISDQWVLTAHHCFRSDLNEQLSLNPDDYNVIVGEHKIREPDEYKQVLEIEKIIPFKPPGPVIADDITLVKLKVPIKFNKYIKPACLPDYASEIVNGETCMVAGWGHEQSNGIVQEAPRHVSLPVFDFETCINKLWIPFFLTKTHFDDKMFCAGTLGRDSCQFDSGGPLMCRDKLTNRFMVDGIVSFGYKCGGKFPGIYVNVRNYTQWIDEVIENE